MDGLTWRKYLQTPDGYHEEAMTETSTEGFYEQNALYTVMSQCSRRERPPLKSVLAGPWRGIHDGTPEVIGWEGMDDSENPQNWSISKKVLVSLLICLLTFAIYIGSAIYTPEIPGVA
jgi:DHA1 family multidrug resistance protein-like MFS transporter